MKYSSQQPFTNGSSPVNATLFANIDNALSGSPTPLALFLITPYHIINTTTINNGNTNTYTATGVGGVPSGAQAVIMGITIESGSVGAYLQLTPGGGTMGQYTVIGNIQVGGQFVNDFVIMPLDGSGNFQAKANGGNVVVQAAYMFGYFV